MSQPPALTQRRDDGAGDASSGQAGSTEHFDAAGYVTESIRERPGKDGPDHWWYERGMPVRRVIGSEEYHKDGKHWVLKKTGKP